MALHSGTMPHLVYRSLPLLEVPTSSKTGFDDQVLKRRFTSTKSTDARLTRSVSEHGLPEIR